MELLWQCLQHIKGATGAGESRPYGAPAERSGPSCARRWLVALRHSGESKFAKLIVPKLVFRQANPPPPERGRKSGIAVPRVIGTCQAAGKT